MKINGVRKRFIKLMGIGLAVFQIANFLSGITIATGGIPDPNFEDPYVSNRRTDVLKIILVLENKIEDQQLLGRTKEKLFTLSDGETRLIASLSDRVTKKGNTTGADIAFLLMTVLITLL